MTDPKASRLRIGFCFVIHSEIVTLSSSGRISV